MWTSSSSSSSFTVTSSHLFITASPSITSVSPPFTSLFSSIPSPCTLHKTHLTVITIIIMSNNPCTVIISLLLLLLLLSATATPATSATPLTPPSASPTGAGHGAPVVQARRQERGTVVLVGGRAKLIH